MAHRFAGGLGLCAIMCSEGGFILKPDASVQCFGREKKNQHVKLVMGKCLATFQLRGQHCSPLNDNSSVCYNQIIKYSQSSCWEQNEDMCRYNKHTKGKWFSC